MRAARGLDQAGLLEQRGDALQVGERQVLRLGDRLQRDGLVARRACPSWISSRTPYSALVVKIIAALKPTNEVGVLFG